MSDGDGPQPHQGHQAPAPSHGDLLWGGDESGGYNPASLLATYPKQVGDWLVRSIITEDDLDFIIHELAEMNAVRRGYTDMEQLIWTYLGGRVSVGGKGREQTLEALVGMRLQHRAMMPWGPFGSLMEALRRPDGKKEAPGG